MNQKNRVGRPSMPLPSRAMTEAEKLAKRIRKMRAGRSIAELAKAADISVGYWHKLERGAIEEPRRKTVSRVLEVLRG